MKKIFNFGSKKGQSPSRSFAVPRRDCGVPESDTSAGYLLRDKELGKLHKAASVGDVAKVQQLLLLGKHDVNDLDKVKRTPLHLACAKGYPDVVSLLVQRKCKLNLCDNDNRTPLIKAVQCQQEECATILLEHGADPNLVDSNNNTALHYAASGQNKAIAAQLLKHKGDIEAKNKEGYTPLLLAVTENNHDIVDFFLKNGANVNASDKSKRTALMIAVSSEPTGIVSLLLGYDVDLSCQDIYGWTVEQYAKLSGYPIHRQLINQYEIQKERNQHLSPQINCSKRVSSTGFILGGPALDKEEMQESPLQTSGTRISGKVEESSAEESLSRLSDKPGADDSWPTTDDEELDFTTKKLPKSNITKIINVSQQIRKSIDEKSSTVNTEHRTFLGHHQSDSEKEDMTDSLPKPSSQAQCSPHPAHPSLRSFSKSSHMMSTLLAINKKGKDSRNGSSQKSHHKKIHDYLRIKDKTLMGLKNSCVNSQKEEELESNQEEGQLEDYEGKVAEEEESEEEEEGEEEEYSQDVQDVIDGEEESDYVDTEDEDEEDFENTKEKEGVNNHQNLCLPTVKYDRIEAKCKISKEKQVTNISTEFPVSVITDIYGKSDATSLKEDSTDSEEEEKEDGILVDNDTGKQTPHETPSIPNEHSTSARSVVRKDMMSALGLEEEDDAESPWDSECTSESLPKGSSRHMLAATNQTIKNSISMEQLEDVPYIPSFLNESRNFKMDKLTDTRSIRMPVGSLDHPQRNPIFKPIQSTLEMKDSFTNQEVEKEVKEKQKSDFMEEFGLDDADDIDDASDWDSTSISQKNESHRNSKDLNFNGNYPCKSLPLIKNWSGSTEFEKIPLKEDEATETATEAESGPATRFRVATLVENAVLRKQCESPLEKEDDKEDFTRELEFKGSSEGNQESFDKSDQEQVEEEKKKHQHNEMETLEGKNGDKLSENIMAGKVNELFSMESNQLNKDDENKIPREEIPIMSISKEISAPVHHLLKNNDFATNRKNVKKPQNNKWIPKDPGMTLSSEKVNSSSGILLHSCDDSSLSETDNYELRPAKKTLNEKNKDKVQVDADDLDDLTQSSDTATEDYDLPPSNYKNIMLLIEQLSVDCKDSIHLLKIQDAVLKYERSVELKKARCTQLKRKVKSLENKITGLQEELSETRKMKSQLEHQKVEWDRELYRLRFTLKQEKEKQLSTEMLFEKTREQLRRKEEQYSKEVELKQQLEFTLRTLDLELRTVKSNFKQVEEERNDAQRQLSREQSARVLQDGILNNYLWKQKEIEAAASKMIQSSEVPDSHEKEKCLLHENQSLLDEVAKLKLELDTIKIKDQEKEDRYTEENEVLKEKNDELQKELKLKEEALRETIFQYSGQVNVLTTENTMLSSKLDNEKQNRDKLETEVESYRSRLNSAILDHERSQTSKLDLENIFQRERDEWLHLQDKLRDNNGVLSQELSKAESKANRLENELYQVCDSLREKTLILESTQRELNQTQNKAKELENKNQMDKEKLDRYIIKQESIQERLAQIQSENMLLRQQLEDAQNKGVIKEKVVNDVQVQFSDLFNKLRADTEKQVLLVEERNKELINECNHLREQMCKYENEKAEREGTVRKLQQELADSLKKQSMTEASLEVTSRYRNDLEDKKKQLQKEVDQIKSKLQESQERHIQSQRSTNELEDHIQKLEIENARLEATVKQQVGKIENIQKNILDSTKLDTEREKLKKLIELKQSLENRLEQEMKRNDELQKDVSGFKKLLKTTKKKLREYEKGEVISQEVLKQTHFDEDRQINRLKNKNEDLTQQLEATSSKCIQLESINRNLREELLSMKSLQKKCDRLERNKRELEEEVVDLKHHLEITKLEHSQVEQYKREIEERANQEIVEKLKEVNLFLQTQAATQDYLEQSRENSNASIRNQMENRIRDLEAELSKMKNSHQDSTKAELEIYRQLYSEELKIRESLSNKLDRTNERLAELSSRLLNEKQKSRILINSFTTSPVLEPPHVGDLHTTMVLNRRLIPRGNLLYSTGNTVSSTNSMEAYLTKMRQELDKSISRELDEANAEFESRSCWAFPVGSTDESTRMPNLNQDPVSRATQEYLEVLKKNYML
ncbi:ankyrin repeat domain-containing protein 26 isoform X6 [Sarcophilus harrisii]|uniref:ankyrin repeat domain-containing protein 26 isoform X6 n=1 Tax=Sarcophilus harrisii TaxID=9305 RepID=UPI001301ECDB|nr:ankyrin repeat domain-containing protein 26 isoform X6 [Sarcophilus harrisii]